MTLLPKLRVQYGEGIGNDVFVQFPDLRSYEKTYLEADIAAGASSLTANGINFAVDNYVLIGNPGAEKSEIIKLHASSAPTATTITLASALSFAHNRGDIVRFIPFNQIVLARSTDGGSSYSVATTVSIRPDTVETHIQRTSDSSTDLYKAQFYNATSLLYGQYSGAYTASGIGFNTFGALKRAALNELGEKQSELYNDEFLIGVLKEARREVDQDPRVRRFSFRTKMNTDIGDIIPGRWSVACPTDLRDPNTADHILGLRLGRSGTKLEYQDVNRFFQNYQTIAHSTLNGAITTASTSIVLTSSGDFDESGTVVIAGESITESYDTVSYTGNTEASATLTGVTLITADHATARDVWQGATFGEPRAFTVIEGIIYFDVPFSNDLAGENIFLDYYQTIQDVTNDSSELDEPEYDMYKHRLKFAIKDKRAKGTLDPKTDPSYLEWLKKKEDFLTKQTTGQLSYFVPA